MYPTARPYGIDEVERKLRLDAVTGPRTKFTKQFLGVCNGYGPDKLSPEAEALVKDAYESCKAKFSEMLKNAFNDFQYNATDYGQFYVGRRCSLDGVCRRLALVSNDITSDNVEYFILDALRDCAGADYWYAFEKRWD